MFDPNAPLPDFATQQLDIDRQRKLSDLLRKQSLESTPNGQMVGRHFVAPSWAEHLSTLAQSVASAYLGNKADTGESALGQAEKAQGDTWRSMLPQATAARPEQPGPPGPDGSPYLEAQPAQPVTREAILKHTLAGLQNPATSKEAMLVNQSLTSDLTRSEDKAFKDQEARTASRERLDNLQSTLQNRKEELEMRLSDSRLAQADRVKLAQQHDETLLEIARINAQARRDAANQHKELTASQQAVQDRFISTQAEHVSRRAEQLAPMLQSAKVVQDMLDTNDVDPRTGRTKPIAGLGYVGVLPGVFLTQEGNANRAKVKAFANSMLRAQAGLSQTLSETENANLELLANGKFTQKEFEQIWPTVMSKINSSVDNLKGGADPLAWEKYVKQSGGRGLEPIKSSRGAVSEGGLTPEQQARLEQLRAAKAAEGK